MQISVPVPSANNLSKKPSTTAANDVSTNARNTVNRTDLTSSKTKGHDNNDNGLLSIPQNQNNNGPNHLRAGSSLGMSALKDSKIASITENVKDKPLAKSEIGTLIKSLSKPKEYRTEADLRIILQMFKPSMLNRRHKFKPRELLECLKRITLKKVQVGEILTNHGEQLDGFSIIVAGQCSRHLTEEGKEAKELKLKMINRSSTRTSLLQDELP